MFVKTIRLSGRQLSALRPQVEVPIAFAFRLNQRTVLAKQRTTRLRALDLKPDSLYLSQVEMITLKTPSG